MGKTAAGAVWLNADLVSPYEYWQYWRNTEDGDVARFLKLFTVLPLDEIARLAALQGAGDQRGEEGARHRSDRAGARPRRRRGRAAATARTTFEEGGLGAESADHRGPAGGVQGRSRRAQRPSSAPASPPRTAKCAAPIANNAIMVNDARVTSEKATIGEADVTPEGVIKLSLGRKRHVLLKPA